MPFEAEDPFAWSVRVHNAVNVRLGKPTLTTVQGADALYGDRMFDFKYVIILILLIILYLKR